MVLMLSIILFSLAVVIFAMLIIIIMNSMVMTAVERIAEVGTMRAVGAGRGFVVRLFLTEALFLGGLFGGIGTAVSGIILSTLPGIPAGNQITRMIFGGEMLRIPIPVSSVLTTLILILIVAALSSAYPAWIASRFKPVEAMNSK